LTAFLAMNTPPAFYPVVAYAVLGYVPFQIIVLVVVFHAPMVCALACLLVTMSTKQTASSTGAKKAATGGSNSTPHAVVTPSDTANGSSVLSSSAL